MNGSLDLSCSDPSGKVRQLFLLWISTKSWKLDVGAIVSIFSGMTYAAFMTQRSLRGFVLLYLWWEMQVMVFILYFGGGSPGLPQSVRHLHFY